MWNVRAASARPEPATTILEAPNIWLVNSFRVAVRLRMRSWAAQGGGVETAIRGFGG